MEKRIIALDTLRGIAAIGILFWHYQHFFSLGPFVRPYEETLAFLYKFGWISVDFFFCLSGYVLYHKYAEPIASQKISVKEFVVLRISRLYPLIVITLLVTAILNYILLYTQGKFFIYDRNDFTAFFLNLLFMQYGFFNVPYSFDAPSWSLAVEFWVYLIFFFLAYQSKQRLPYFTLMVALVFLSLTNKEANWGLVIFTPDFERGIGGFFLGGLTYYIVQGCGHFSERTRNVFGMILLAIPSIACLLIATKMTPTPPLQIGSLMVTDNLSLAVIGFPSLIMAFTLSPVLQKLLSIKPFKFLGDISYSSYLWHFPIQLAIFILILDLGVPIDVTGKPFFFGYMIFVLLVSYLSTHWLEKPAQRFIREKFLR